MDTKKTTKLSTHTVNITDIDCSPGPYCMSFGFDLKPLIRSINKIGLINNPLVIRNGQGKFTIISGYRRIMAFKSLKSAKVPCKILLESGLSPLECLLINLYENLATRRLNEIEKGMVLNRLARWLPKDEILDHYMGLLELPSHEPTLVFFIRLDRELNEEIKECLVKDYISKRSVGKLLDMEHDSMLRVFRLLSTLNFNFNQQNQLIEYLTDLSYINDTQILTLLDTYRIERISSDPKLNNPQKAKAILRFLRAKRYPSLVNAEETFKKKISSLRLPEGVIIEAPEYFEASHYSLKIIYKDGKELAEKIEDLVHTKGLTDLCDPWERGA